ncbi:MAG: outer membrane beta-barrel protein [Nitrospiraceae bacterium]
MDDAVNEYQYLSHANNLPSYVAVSEWRTSKHVTLYENLYYGPDQQRTDLKFWRLFSDSTVEWHEQEWVFALSYDIGTEDVAEQPGAPRAFWMGSALFTQWNITGPWHLAIRPEFYWDRNGRMTHLQQVIWANTSTLEYRRHFGPQMTVVRLEHRYDHSTGEDGGFFKNGMTAGQPRLVGGQHLLLLSAIWALDLQL